MTGIMIKVDRKLMNDVDDEFGEDDRDDRGRKGREAADDDDANDREDDHNVDEKEGWSG